MGFADGTDLLLVISWNGRGVFDCQTGTRIARDYHEMDESWYNPVQLSALGIGPLAGVTIRLAGLHGGGLPVVTADGWSVEVAYPDWPDGVVILEPPGTSVYIEDRAIGCVKVADIESARGYGFSGTGRTLVVSESHTLQIFTRSMGAE